MLIFSITAIFSVGYMHPDEHFQLLEFASYKAGNPNTHLDILAWEYKAHIRPSAQVFIAYNIILAAKALGLTDPFAIATFLRLLTALLSLGCLVVMYCAFRPHFTKAISIHALLFLSAGLWFIPFLAVRFSSETWSGACFFLAVGWLMLRPQANKTGVRLGVALLLGLSFLFRYQAGFLIAGLLLWLFFVQKEYKKPGFYLLPIGILIIAALGVLLDRWLYNAWVFSPWEYIKVNIFQGKAEEYGRAPWYGYFVMLPDKASPFIGLLLIVSMFWLWAKRPRHVLTWVSLPFVLVHVLLSHKELRFLNPLMFMLPVALAFLAEDVYARFRYRKTVVALFFIFNTPLLLYVMFAPANLPVKALQLAHDQSREGPMQIFYTSGNPYLMAGIPLTFYAPEDTCMLVCEKVDRPARLLRWNFGNAVLFSSKLRLDDSLNAPNMNISLVHQRIPRVCTAYGNFFHWVDRTTIDCIYECRKMDTKRAGL